MGRIVGKEKSTEHNKSVVNQVFVGINVGNEGENEHSMRIENPVIRGFYPDPSVCEAQGKYYLVCSSMQYFPGVPLFESDDLLTWKQIGHCLTRPEQIELNHINSSGGVFAPTIRYHEGRFYMVTTNDTLHRNFYVWTDKIYGEWSDPVFVDQGGIDPTLYFDQGHTYFISNGSDDEGVAGIVQCEIDITTGARLSPRHTIWTGSGGRYLEGPHIYHVGNWYYLLCAEGGTEYGHMVTLARSNRPDGGYESCPFNPVLTNRNLGGYEVQGVGHGDLIQDVYGNWWLLHLGFRQIEKYLTFHHLGRETFLTPVTFTEDGWMEAGEKGTVRKVFDTDRLPDTQAQQKKMLYTFANTAWDLDWCYLRIPHHENYSLGQEKLILTGTNVTLDDVDSPTFIGLRQKEFTAEIRCQIKAAAGEAGVTMLMDENHHYDVAIRKTATGWEALERLNIGDIKSVEKQIPLGADEATLIVRADKLRYTFAVLIHGEEVMLGTAQTRYLSSEVAGGFTGVMIGLYACGFNRAEFTNFRCEYQSESSDE